MALFDPNIFDPDIFDTGAVDNTATGAVTLPSLSASGGATFTSSSTATGAVTLPALSAAGSGTVSAPGTVTATGAVTLGALSAAGTATFVSSSTATGVVTLPSLTASGAATFTALVTRTATGAATLPSLTCSATATFVMTGIVVRAERLVLTRNDDYFDADTRRLEFPMLSTETWPDLTDATVHLEITVAGTGVTHSIEGTVVTATGSDRKVAFELDQDQTGEAGYGKFSIVATLASANTATLRRGEVWIRP